MLSSGQFSLENVIRPNSTLLLKIGIAVKKSLVLNILIQLLRLISCRSNAQENNLVKYVLLCSERCNEADAIWGQTDPSNFQPLD